MDSDPPFDRRRLLSAAATSIAAGIVGCLGSETADPGARDGTTGGTTDGSDADSIPDSLGLRRVVGGIETPLDVAFAPDADRRYVADQGGRIFVHDADGLRDDPFLDLRDAIETGGEMGLLGLALHPNFAGNRRLFVRYSSPRREGTPENYSHTFVLSEFEASGDGLRVDRDSERTLLEIPEPQSNHNAGSVVFGPDGYLYVGVGDGGAGGDQGTGHVDDWYDGTAGGNGQDVTANLLGSVLRIDVDASGTSDANPSKNGGDGGENAPYGIPEDNPLVGKEGRPEIYAWGFRNPWRLSFDGEDFYVGDVGQSAYEEVDLVERGGNYGWNVREGTHCYGADECPSSTPKDVRGGEPLLDPIIEYPHSGAEVSGSSVIGGHVYRGSAIPALQGAYVFGDLSADGRLFVATRPDGDGRWPTRVVEMAGDTTLSTVLSFGRDAAGEVYVLGTGSSGGGLYRIVPTS